MQTRQYKDEPAANGAVRGLGRRLTLSYWLFSSLTIALLLGALMAVAFLAQWASGDLYRMAYSDQVNAVNIRIIDLRDSVSIELALHSACAVPMDGEMRSFAWRRKHLPTRCGTAMPGALRSHCVVIQKPPPCRCAMTARASIRKQSTAVLG